jgi:hypothetical protein
MTLNNKREFPSNKVVWIKTNNIIININQINKIFPLKKKTKELLQNYKIIKVKKLEEE